MAVDWKETSEKSTKELMDCMAEACAAGNTKTVINTANAVRLLANAIYSTFKSMDDQPDFEDLINRVAFLSGIAVGVLSDYADDLESREPKGD